jgi:hypothetical protein
MKSPSTTSPLSESPEHKKSNNTDSAHIHKESTTVINTHIQDKKNQPVSNAWAKKQPNCKAVTFQQVLLSKPNTSSTSCTTPKPTMLTVLPPQQQRALPMDTESPITPASKEIVQFVNVPPTTVMLSTMTADNVTSKLCHSNSMITCLSDTQIMEITNAVSTKYDSVIQQMQEAHEKQLQDIVCTQKAQDEAHKQQINSIANTQKAHNDEINAIKTSQKELKNDMQDQLDNKINMQTSLLHSMMTMMKDIKATKIDADSSNMIVTTEQQSTSIKMTPAMIHQSQDHDISYSESDSDQDVDKYDGAMTASTLQSTVGSSHQDFNHSAASANETVIHTSTQVTCPDSSQYPKDTDRDNSECQHVNNIAVDSKNDIRKVTMTSKVDPDELVKGAGWNDVNDHSKKKIPLRHAIISPPKRQTRSSYKKEVRVTINMTRLGKFTEKVREFKT